MDTVIITTPGQGTSVTIPEQTATVVNISRSDSTLVVDSGETYTVSESETYSSVTNAGTISNSGTLTVQS